MDHVVLKHRQGTLGRIQRFITGDFYNSVNLFGSWSTHWFKLHIDIPESWEGEQVRLLWHSDCEGLIWDNGKPAQGLSGYPSNMVRRDYILSKTLSKGELRREIFIEAACNGMVGVGDQGDLIKPPDPHKTFSMDVAEIAVIDKDVFDLLMDFEVLFDIAKSLNDEGHRSSQALLVCNEMINVLDVNDKATYPRARQLARDFLSQKNGASQMTVHAMGHAHIDSAWLWPYDESIRKCARSWSSSVGLMKRYPEMTFTCSQAQQLQWVKDAYPSLYAEIKQLVTEGRFIPVGGTWVEMDGNLPSGESFVRQVLYGQRFFQHEFGIKCREFWLPDTFGYSPQLPQIVSSGGMDRFLTQKLSWSVNKFPHHTFIWEGLDGTRLLTHFPPGDSYHMTGAVRELVKTVTNCQDKGRVFNAGYLYGYGDGGGGPTELMLERLSRLADVDGCPRVKHSSPDSLFAAIESTEKRNLCRWVGELYLEFHQGTYTSQAQTKKMNRKCEILLRDVECLCSIATAVASHDYPRRELDRIWKLLLLNQFHDVLPGSSINEVYVDAHKYYSDIQQTGQSLLKAAVDKMLKGSGTDKSLHVTLNTLGWDRTEVVEISAGSTSMADDSMLSNASKESKQSDTHGNHLVLVKSPSIGFAVLEPIKPTYPVKIKKLESGLVLMENEHVRAELDTIGRLVSLYTSGCHKNAIQQNCVGNQFVIFDDTPVYWDAWDLNHYHLETRRPLSGVTRNTVILKEGPLRASVKFGIQISDVSCLTQVVSLDADSPYIRFDTQVDWHESHKILKVEFPVNVRAAHASYEVQFGLIQRPTHCNTEWDWMKFEVGAQRWVDLSEYNFGVSLLNDCKYGHSVQDNIMRLSLLKASKAPDEKADMGKHSFTYAILPHSGTFQNARVVHHAAALNSPLRLQAVADVTFHRQMSYFSVDNPAVIIDTVKRSEDHDGILVLRVYEALGGAAKTVLHTSLSLSAVQICNVLEEPDEESAVYLCGQHISLELRPFQVLSMLLTLA